MIYGDLRVLMENKAADIKGLKGIVESLKY